MIHRNRAPRGSNRSGRLHLRAQCRSIRHARRSSTSSAESISCRFYHGWIQAIDDQRGGTFVLRLQDADDPVRIAHRADLGVGHHQGRGPPAAMAFLKPRSMPAGESIRTKSHSERRSLSQSGSCRWQRPRSYRAFARQG
ncbi:MAG: hypothetical protein MZV64_62340 [Ignavibacteriales bacterium]|nr:hypothetical protein [Ignavibacteriales bacterium]